MNDQIRKLIFQTIDQSISPDDFERLQDAIEQSEDVRTEYLRAVHLTESLGEIADEVAVVNGDQKSAAGTIGSADPTLKHQAGISFDPPTHGRDRADAAAWNLRTPKRLVTAAAILVVVSGIAFWFGQNNTAYNPPRVSESDERNSETAESLIAGHATLRRAVDLKWGDANPYREGDVLPNGILRFGDGVAEIDFFCGASLIVEGPATLDLESDWSVRVIEGRLRASVPPAARGFIVRAAGSEIIDLGTEFAMEVGSDSARVEVIDGEVALRGGVYDGDHLVTGQHQLLKGTTRPNAFAGLSTLKDVQRRSDNAATQRFTEWKQHSQQLKADNRLIAYYPIASTLADRVIPNAAATGSDRDGQLVGPVDRTAGRFGAESAGLQFDRPGARLRTRIDGEFQAFTFMCWVRIDSLEHRYNALFMSDGYETGELHWQIRDDGSLMFSVMVDDTVNVSRFDETDQRMIKTAGQHHVYYTRPFWDISKSGQWFHIAAVYDPAGRRVVQYVNGKQISSEEITGEFHIDTLRIGPAEIGNWGQPFRKSPWFAVRNQTGTIDELAIFNAALVSEEINSLYEQGKPLGY